jgi:hypothetical protein
VSPLCVLGIVAVADTIILQRGQAAIASDASIDQLQQPFDRPEKPSQCILGCRAEGVPLWEVPAQC